MSSPFALPALVRARAIAATSRPWLTDGVHFRVRLSPWIGFPIHPLAAWRLGRTSDPVDVPIVWCNADGKTVRTPFKIEDSGGELFGTVQGAAAGNRWIWIEFQVNDGGMRIDLLDSTVVGSGSRILMSRSREPFRFGDSELLSFRVTGAGDVLGATGIAAESISVEQIAERQPDFTFGLPIEPGPWYAQDRSLDDPRDLAFRRVRAAAPRRLSPPDNPSGALPDNTDPDAEAQRIINAVAPELVDPWLKRGFQDPGTAPALSVLIEPGPAVKGRQVTAAAQITPSLFTMAVDPQIARYLGLATLVPFCETPTITAASFWILASRWAIQRDRVVRRIDRSIADIIPLSPPNEAVQLSAFLDASAAVPAFVDSELDHNFPDAAAIVSRLPDVRDPDGSGPWSVMTLLALAVAAGDAPPDPPDPFELTPDLPGAWNPQPDLTHPGPDSWRQSISLGDRPARGMVGFARMTPGTPVALQRLFPDPGLGVTSRVLPLVPNWASNHLRVLTDRSVPPDASGASWQVWQADEFGQWSERAQLSEPLPARPLPPVPVVEATYSAAPDDGSTGTRVPGVIHLRVGVPSLLGSTPGSLPIAQLKITIDGAPQPEIAVAPSDELERDFDAPPFGVGAHRQVPITAVYLDSGNSHSPAQTLSCGVYDARAPRAVPTSPLIIWTGAPDATSKAELALKWPPRTGAERYRIYLGDVRRLAGQNITLSAVRSADAKPIHDASSDFGDKHLFTFLGETPATAGADGMVHYSTQIPGALRGLQFVRIVPLTWSGAEAPFSHCGLVPVAIPGTDRPPPPALNATTDPAAGVTLTIRARGLHKELVQAGAGNPPEYRIRRTRRTGGDQVYAPIRPGGLLAGPDAEGVWSATVHTAVGDLDPFVRYFWFAEVRYPPEPAIPPDLVPEPVDGGVEPVWMTLGSASEGVWSDLSLAAESLLIPFAAPPAPSPPIVTRNTDGTVTVKLANLLVAAADAIGTYRLEIHQHQDDAPPTLLATLTPTSPKINWTSPAPAPAGFALVTVDPIGRRSQPTYVALPPA